MLAVLFYRQYARHVSQRHIAFVFQEITKEVQVFCLVALSEPLYPENASHSSMMKMKGDPCFSKNVLKCAYKIIVVEESYLRIIIGYIEHQSFLKLGNNTGDNLFGREIDHVDMNDIVLIQMLLKAVV